MLQRPRHGPPAPGSLPPLTCLLLHPPPLPPSVAPGTLPQLTCPPAASPLLPQVAFLKVDIDSQELLNTVVDHNVTAVVGTTRMPVSCTALQPLAVWPGLARRDPASRMSCTACQQV
jgi:hypothetical protein